MAALPFGKVIGFTSDDNLPDKFPKIDVHMHAYPADTTIDKSLLNPITGKPPQIKNGEEHLRACLAEMKRLNIVRGIVSGGTGDRLAAATHWREADPERIIGGAGVRGSEDAPLPSLNVLREAFQSGRLRVLGEVTAEYAGLTLSDTKYAPYLSLAEELDIPVSLHTGTGPPGISFDPCCRAFRVSLGNPALIEDALNRHPKLRVNLMHAGWPYLQETIALLLVYPQVYVDVGAISWLPPRAEFHAYLSSIVRAGFGDRVMFGSDQMFWPEAIGMAVEAVEAASFLSETEKKNIFFGNAVRFFKLKELSKPEAH
ncbi:MAG TPA: amidohydrolase family protein [Terriglobales bacterium]|nr:amidohydrolase family protein [Terriglobales bacterium]